MREKTKKATFNLHPSVLAELDKVTAIGFAPSKNAFVERALIKELKEMKRQLRQARWQEASQDPALLKDISDVKAAFESADNETAGRMD